MRAAFLQAFFLHLKTQYEMHRHRPGEHVEVRQLRRYRNQNPGVQVN